ncbi:MAG: 16S rRNA (cytosine(1402)-N(4))-methyltransferase RsmH [Thermoflexales bacterium]|nr:16S rRNA (cytosine(1402)-N(4))-methyltransferase RsmH [Thermoflexales bacterium]
MNLWSRVIWWLSPSVSFMTTTQHVSVLPQETRDGLALKPGGRYIDGTVGGGGHSESILSAAPDIELLGLDADPAAIERATLRLAPFGSRVKLVNANFAQLGEVARAHGFDQVDGVVLDLGLSSDQLEDRARGFGFQTGGPLDMRFDPTRGETAADLANNLDQDELADVIYRYGEDPASRKIARAIVAARPILTAQQLAEVIEQAMGRHGRIHPATLTFQALRIAVNDELGSLMTVLPQATEVLKSGGRLAVISFHSLEDRIVKEYFRSASRERTVQPDDRPDLVARPATLKLITRKPIVPGDEEVAANSRARSAKLRIAERL